MTSPLFCYQCKQLLDNHSEKKLIDCVLQLCEVVKT